MICPLFPTSTTSNPPTQSTSISGDALPPKLMGANLCLAKTDVHFEIVLRVQQVNKYLMTVDDLLTFTHTHTHTGPDELLRAELSVTSAGPAPGGIEREGYLWSHLAQVSIARPPPADWTLWPRGKASVGSAGLSQCEGWSGFRTNRWMTSIRYRCTDKLETSLFIF